VEDFVILDIPLVGPQTEVGSMGKNEIHEKVEVFIIGYKMGENGRIESLFFGVNEEQGWKYVGYTECGFWKVNLELQEILVSLSCEKCLTPNTFKLKAVGLNQKLNVR
jgi:hypothetical protein